MDVSDSATCGRHFGARASQPVPRVMDSVALRRSQRFSYSQQQVRKEVLEDYRNQKTL